MASASNPTPQSAEQNTDAEVAVITDSNLLAKFAEMAVMIPADTGNATEDILRTILGATTWEDLNTPWDTAHLSDVLGRKLRLMSATRRPSNKTGGLGMFLVLHLVDPATGKEIVKSTGSISIVGQVARAYALGHMPCIVEWCRADRDSEAGFRPQHLKIHGRYVPSSPDAS